MEMLIHPVPHKLLIFDVDGTLRRCTVPGQLRPNNNDEWELMPGVCKVIEQYSPANHCFGIVSNQNGVALGYFDELMAERLLYNLMVTVWPHAPEKEQPRWRTRYAMCPHAPDAGCDCRKPAPKLLQSIMEFFKIGPEDTLYIGDLRSDQEAASAAEVDFVWARDFFNWPF